MKVCIAPFRVLANPEVGGYAWIHFNWALGLQANGCDVTWLEALPAGVEPAEALRRVSALQGHMDQVGLRARLAFLPLPDDTGRLTIERNLEELAVPWEDAAEEADLLLNFRYSLEQTILDRFRRTALIDIDPGLLQLWVSQGQVRIGSYDLHLTVGETVGQPGARFPDCGRHWHYTPIPVFLPSWQVVPASGTAPYTAVSNWMAAEWVMLDGQGFRNDKRTSFLEYLDLPSQVPAPLELALCFSRCSDSDREDCRVLEQHGWKVRHAWDVTRTPTDFQCYVRRSRGEYGCAKPFYIRLQTAWISDRTPCYLASGKPVVVQHTGPSRYLPDTGGLFRFRNLEEAANAISKVERDYDRQSRLARALAEEYFDAAKVVQNVLERALN